MPLPTDPPAAAKAQAMLLAAGRGERMRPLTDTCPKPLLQVRGKALMQWHLEALTRSACTRAVVNTAWLGEQVEQAFAAVSIKEKDHWSTSNNNSLLLKTEPLNTLPQIRYSREGRDFGGALETAGGITRALPLLEDVFWVLAGDVYAPGFVFSQSAVEVFGASGKLAHLWLVPNPAHNPQGDFGLSPDGLALNLPKDSPEPKTTYSTIGLYRSALFLPPWCDIPAGNPQGVKAGLAPLLRKAMDQHQVSAEIFHGQWVDVGTPERLRELNQRENGPPSERPAT